MTGTDEWIRRRIRNRIVEGLEVICDPSETARLGLFSTINLWDDFAGELDPDVFSARVFTDMERAAVRRVSHALDAASPGLREDMHEAAALQASASWRAVQGEAAKALAIFLFRGKLPED